MTNQNFDNTKNQVQDGIAKIQGKLGEKSLTRSRDDRMLAGVCGGLAAYAGIDATIVRLALVAAVVLGFGTGFLLYIVAWILMPEAV